MPGRRACLKILLLGAPAGCLALHAGNAAAEDATPGWRVMKGASGEVWQYVGNGGQIRAALESLARRAEAPLRIGPDNTGQTRVGGRPILIELRYAA
jgi:hypothetical protein